MAGRQHHRHRRSHDRRHVFYFQIHTGINGVDAFPEGAQTREAFFVLEEHFSFGIFNPTDIVIDGDIDSPPVQQAIGKLQASLEAHEGLQVLPGPIVNDAGDLAVLTAIIPGEPRNEAALDVVEAIRSQYIPGAFQGVDAEVLVGGTTAVATDVFDIVQRYTPVVFAFVLGFSFLVLMLVFRSIVIPIKAIIMNLTHSLINSAPLIAGIVDPRSRRALAHYVYRLSFGLIGKETAQALMYPSVSYFGVVWWFRMQQRYGHILNRLSPGWRKKSNFARFTTLLDTALYDEEGIRYELPDHVYAEEASQW